MEKKMIWTEEMLQQAKACKSVEELLALARENGRELTEEEAKGYFEKLNPANGELADDELDSVSGGGLCDNDSNKYIKNNDGYCSACVTTKLTLTKISVMGAEGYYWYCGTCKKRTEKPVNANA